MLTCQPVVEEKQKDLDVGQDSKAGGRASDRREKKWEVEGRKTPVTQKEFQRLKE